MEKTRLWFRPIAGKWGLSGRASHQGLPVKLCLKIFSGAVCELCEPTESKKLQAGFPAGELEVVLVRHKGFNLWGEGRYYIAHIASVPATEKEALEIIDEGGEIDVSGVNAVLCCSRAGKGILIDPGSMGFEEKKFSLKRFVGDREVAATVLTHGHNDHRNHLGQVDKGPVFMTELAYQLALRDAEWHKDDRLAEALRRTKKITPGKQILFNNGIPLCVETFSVPHSIPEALGLVVQGLRGTLVHLGDFKFNGMDPRTKPELIARLSRIAREPVDYLVLNIVNAHIPGFTPIEALAIDAITDIVIGAKARVIISCFSTNLERIRRIVEVCHLLGRPVRFFGAGMQNAESSEFLKGTLRRGNGEFNSDKAVLFVTGCQAEPWSVLSRLAKKKNPPFELKTDDTVTIAARCIPGNEQDLRWQYGALKRQVGRLIVNTGEIEQVGAGGLGLEEVPTHLSGHEQGGGLRLALEIIRPRKGVIVSPYTSPQIEAFRKIASTLGIKVLDEKERVIEI